MFNFTWSNLNGVCIFWKSDIATFRLLKMRVTFGAISSHLRVKISAANAEWRLQSSLPDLQYSQEILSLHKWIIKKDAFKATSLTCCCIPGNKFASIKLKFFCVITFYFVFADKFVFNYLKYNSAFQSCHCSDKTHLLKLIKWFPAQQ